jgi:hypothetical protein
VHLGNSSEQLSETETAMAMAENLARLYESRSGDLVAFFAAFVGVVFERDKTVGRDALTAIDRLVSG